MIKITTVEQMRAIEAAADKAGVSYAQMMETAGRAIANRVKGILSDYAEPRVVVLVGPGNNGGDGLVAGRIIAEETHATVIFFLTKSRAESDENLAKVQKANLLITDATTDAEQGYRVLRTMVANADVIIDAILGTGAKSPIKGDLQKVLIQIHKALADRQADRSLPSTTAPVHPKMSSYRKPVIVAVDLPTGLDADTGTLDEHTLYADETVTFEAIKPGHVTLAGHDAVGVLHIASLNLPEKLKPRDSIKRMLVDAAYVRDQLPDRPANANKGTFGKTLIVGGSLNYIGAPALAAQAAYRVGTGLVTVAVPQPLTPILATHILEATWVLLPHDLGVLNSAAVNVLREAMAGYSAMLLGPGLGQEDSTKEFIDGLLIQRTKKAARRMGFAASETEQQNPDDVALPPLVIDADGLNLLSKVDEWWTYLPPNTVLTPHPGEMARLVKIETKGNKKATDVVQSDRLTLAAECAAKWNCVVVLKGAHTVIAEPGGKLAVSPFANAALARAGTGDVLGGAIAGYIAQGLEPFEAAIVGIYVHGLAGEFAADYIGTKASVLASDVLDSIAIAISTIEQAE